MELNSDPNQRVVLDTALLAWDDDRAGAVSRKPLAHAGGTPAETTGIARYPPGARWPEADGVELLVLGGGLNLVAGADISACPAGSYLRLPPGWRGELEARDGCTLFLKRGHLGRDDPRYSLLRPRDRVWRPGLVPGLRVLSLGAFEAAQTALVRWDPGTRFQYHRHYGGEEILVLEGVFQDEHGDYPAGTWLRSPHLSAHEPYSEPGCLIYVKVGHLPPAA